MNSSWSVNKTATQRSEALFSQDMKVFPIQTVLCVIQGCPLTVGTAARELSHCRHQAAAHKSTGTLVSGSPFSSSLVTFSKALLDTGTWKNPFTFFSRGKKNFLWASGDMASASNVCLCLKKLKKSLPFLSRHMAEKECKGSTERSCRVNC